MDLTIVSPGSLLAEAIVISFQLVDISGAGKAGAGKAVAGKAAPGKAAAGKAVAGRAVAGKTVSDKAVSDKAQADKAGFDKARVSWGICGTDGGSMFKISCGGLPGTA